MTTPILELFVEGTPQPQGSMRSMPYKRKDGTTGISTFSANAKTMPWRDKVERAIRDAMIEQEVQFNPNDPIFAEMEFSFQVPKTKVKKKTGYPLYMTNKPDYDKLCRAISDAFTESTGIDDSRIFGGLINKNYVLDYKEVGVKLRFTQLQQCYVGRQNKE